MNTNNTREWPDWRGELAVCISNGPSLTDEQLGHVRFMPDVRTIGINDIGTKCPWVDLWYAADFKFWFYHREQMKAFDGWTVGANLDPPNSNMPNLRDEIDFELKVAGGPEDATWQLPQCASGGHSGIQALQLAIMLGATTILLLGYDCKPKGRQHNHIAKKAELDNGGGSAYSRWPGMYRNLRPPNPVTILNCTPGSAISCYPNVELCEALC